MSVYPVGAATKNTPAIVVVAGLRTALPARGGRANAVETPAPTKNMQLCVVVVGLRTARSSCKRASIDAVEPQPAATAGVAACRYERHLTSF